MLGALGRWLLRWALLAGLWLALTDTHALPELLTGAVAAAIGATLAGLLTRVGPPKTVSKSLSAATLGPRLLRPMWRLIADTALLTAELGRAVVRRRMPSGSFVSARYHPEAARRSAVGRAITETWGSLAANRYVVGIDEERGLILVHELVKSDQPVDSLSAR